MSRGEIEKLFPNRTWKGIQIKAGHLKIIRNLTVWSKEDFETLKNLYYQGLKYDEIGKKLGRSYDSVVSKLYREGLIKKKDKDIKTFDITDINDHIF